MSADGKFNKSLFGFNKRQVLGFFEDYQNEKQSEIDEIKEQTASAREDAERFKRLYESAAILNDDLEKKFELCRTSLDRLKETADALKRELDAKNELSARVGDIIIDAKADAHNIVERANDSARSIIDSADSSAAFTLEQIDSTKQDLGKIRSSLEETMSDFNRKLALIDETLETAKSQIAESKKARPITIDDLSRSGVIGGK